MEEANLFVEFINITGTVVSDLSFVVNVPPGPTVVPVAWQTSDFVPAFDVTQDYIVMAFFTDRQRTTIDTASRFLASFQDDPRAIASSPGSGCGHDPLSSKLQPRRQPGRYDPHTWRDQAINELPAAQCCWSANGIRRDD